MEGRKGWSSALRVSELPVQANPGAKPPPEAPKEPLERVKVPSAGPKTASLAPKGASVGPTGASFVTAPAWQVEGHHRAIRSAGRRGGHGPPLVAAELRLVSLAERLCRHELRLVRHELRLVRHLLRLRLRDDVRCRHDEEPFGPALLLCGDGLPRDRSALRLVGL